MNDKLKDCGQCDHVNVCKHVALVADLANKLSPEQCISSKIHEGLFDALANNCSAYCKPIVDESKTK